MNDSRFDPKQDDDLVGRLIRTSGRAPTPPPDARERVYAAVQAEWRRNVAPRPVARKRRSTIEWLGVWLKPGLAVAAAAAIAIGIGSFVERAPDIAPVELASLGLTVGEVSIRLPGGGSMTRPAVGTPLVAGTRLLTGAAGGAAITLSSGEALRLNVDTEIVLATADHVELASGAVYLDSESASGANPVVIATRHGDVRHIGTQYEVDVADARLRVRVREGAVAVAAGGDEIIGNAGQQVVVPSTGEATTTAFPTTDPEWRWAERLAALPEAPGYPLTEVLEWVARQTGRNIEFASPGIEQRAAMLELNGVAGLTPDEIIDVVTRTTDLNLQSRDASIVVD